MKYERNHIPLLLLPLTQDPPPPGIFSKAQLSITMTKIESIFGLKALWSGKRATHSKGFGAIGQVTIVKDPKFPEHEFFIPGRTFPVRLRHASIRFEDDAMSDFRGASLKFADSDDESPLDIIMSTGCVGGINSTQALWDAVECASGKLTVQEYMLLNPIK